jgi:hypothetical protein
MFFVGTAVQRPSRQTTGALRVTAPGVELDAQPLGERVGPAARAAPAAPPESSAVTGQTLGDIAENTNPGTTPPKIAKTTDLEVRVGKGSFERQWRRAQDVAAKHGGFVTASTTEMLRRRLARGAITIRVPADQLDAATADFRRLGTLVRQSTTGRDVSAQIVDFDARLRSMRAQEAQLLELMRQAKSLSETLEVRTRLDQVRTEIEQVQARRDTTQGQVDFSTLQATIYEPDAEPAGEPVPLGRLGAAWHNALDGVVNIAAGFVVVAGYALPLAAIVLGGWFVARAVRRRGA